MAGKKDKREGDEDGTGLGLGGLLGGLGSLIENLGALAGQAEALRKAREEAGQNAGDASAGPFRFESSVRFRTGIVPGTGEDQGTVRPIKPFAADRPVPPEAPTRPVHRASVREVQEPPADLFDEDDHVMVVFELPGVDDADIDLQVHEDILTLTARGPDKSYRKEVLLPVSSHGDGLRRSFRNGVLEVRLEKPGPGSGREQSPGPG